MAILDIVTIVITVGGLVSALAMLHGKFIAPASKIIKQVKENKKNVAALEEKIAELKEKRREDNMLDREVRSILLESLMAILEALEKTGANGPVTAAKKKIIEFLSNKL